MAEPHAHSQPIQTYGPAPHNRNIWPYNSQAAAPPSRLADSFVCFGSCSHITTMMSARNGRLSLPITFFNNFAVASSLLRRGGRMLLRTGSQGSGVGRKVPDTMRIVAFNFTSRRLV